MEFIYFAVQCGTQKNREVDRSGMMNHILMSHKSHAVRGTEKQKIGDAFVTVTKE